MVSRLLTIITGRLTSWIFECTHGLKQTNNQSRWSDFYIKCCGMGTDFKGSSDEASN